jgi:molecular chaperone GrpE
MEDKDREALYGEPVPAEDAGEPSAGAGKAAGTEEPGDAGELKSRLAYLMAEFDNYRKRVAREREAQEAYGNEKLLRAILPFLDNLERAMGQEGAPAETILEGIRMTRDSFLAEMGKFGLEQLCSEGKPFDPSVHEAIGTAPGTGAPEGTVLAESRKGYLLNGRLLRPANVIVALAPASDATDGQEG